MKKEILAGAMTVLIAALTIGISSVGSAQEASMPGAVIDGTGPGWRDLTEADFTKVNCEPATWTWKGPGQVHCTGKPVGVIRTKDPITNFEMVAEWRHQEFGGNSGIFAWASPASIARLEQGEGRLPEGVEIQILDLGYKTNYEKSSGKEADWFTCHGDVFPTGSAKMKPFPPVSPNGSRSFPSSERSKGAGEWNHYYVRCINGEVRLWVNGVEVSGGTGCEPATGYLCLESEGAPIDFRNLRIRILP
jgi:hypothetical protein